MSFINFFKIQTAHAASKVNEAVTVLNQAANPTGIQQVPLLDMVADVMGALLGMVGVIFFVMIVYGAYMWFASGGADEKTKKGRGIIITAISGLMIVLATGALTSFIFDRLTSGNITPPREGTGLGAPWGGGPVGGGLPTAQAGDVSGCCIDRVGEYNFARRVTTESDCITNQGGDAYSLDLIGVEKTGEGATGIRGKDWDFYGGKNAVQCDKIFSCWDGKLGTLFGVGSSSETEFQQCLNLYGVDEESLNQIWCLKVNPAPTKSVCSKMGAKACADTNGVNYADDETLCKTNEADQNVDKIWCFNPGAVECNQGTVSDCKLLEWEIVLGGREACEKKIAGEVWCLENSTKTCLLLDRKECVAPNIGYGPGMSGQALCIKSGGVLGGKVLASNYCLVENNNGIYSCETCKVASTPEEVLNLPLQSRFDNPADCAEARVAKEQENKVNIGQKNHFCYDEFEIKCIESVAPCVEKTLEFFSAEECEMYVDAKSVGGDVASTNQFCVENCAVVDGVCRGAVGINNALCLQKCKASQSKCFAVDVK